MCAYSILLWLPQTFLCWFMQASACSGSGILSTQLAIHYWSPLSNLRAPEMFLRWCSAFCTRHSIWNLLISYWDCFSSFFFHYFVFYGCLVFLALSLCERSTLWFWASSKSRLSYVMLKNWWTKCWLSIFLFNLKAFVCEEFYETGMSLCLAEWTGSDGTSFECISP